MAALWSWSTLPISTKITFCYKFATVASRATKFGMSMHLEEYFILSHLTPDRFPKLWLPDGKICFFFTISNWSRAAKIIFCKKIATVAPRATKFGMSMHLEEYFILFHLISDRFPKLWLPDGKIWFFSRFRPERGCLHQKSFSSLSFWTREMIRPFLETR